MKFYGRQNELDEFNAAICRGGFRMLVEGPAGIGKSALLSQIFTGFPAHPQRFAVFHKIRSAAFSHREFVGGIAKQLLAPLSHSSFDWGRAREILASRSAEFSGQLLGAMLMDTLKATVGINLQNTAQSLSGIFRELHSKTYGEAIVQNIVSDQWQEMLVPLFSIFDLLEQTDHVGTLFLVSAESGGPTVQECTLELLRSLPDKWSIFVGVNSETDEGLACVRKYRALGLKHGVERRSIGGVTLDVASAIWREKHPEPSDSTLLANLNHELQGRPRLLRDCTLETNPLEVVQSMKTNLADLYRGRVHRLDENARKLIRKLAFLQAFEPFSFEMLHRLTGLSDTLQSLAAIDALREAMLLDVGPDSGEAFFFAHTAVAASVREGLPTSVTKQIASELYGELQNLNVESDAKNLCEIDLVRFGGANPLEQKHLKSTDRLLRVDGSFEKCVLNYEAVLKHASELPLIVSAQFCLAEAYYFAGKYEIALAFLDKIAPSIADTELGRLKLLQGRVHIRLNNYAEAEQFLTEAQAVYEEQGSISGAIAARKELNVILRDTERYEEAVSLANEIVKEMEGVKRDVDVKVELTRSACWRALARSLAYNASNYDSGVEAANEALRIASYVPSLSAQASSLLARAECERHAFKYGEAINDYRQSAKIARSIANKDCYLWACLGLSDALFLSKDYPSARSVLAEIEIDLIDAAEHHPLEFAHYQLSVSVLEFVAGGCRDQSLVEKEPDLYSRLNIQWPANYLKQVRSTCDLSLPKNL